MGRLGNGSPGLKDGRFSDCSFNEPTDIASIRDRETGELRVYIADCNNSCIRCVDLTNECVYTVEFYKVPKSYRDICNSLNSRSTSEGTTTDNSDYAVHCEGDICTLKEFR